MLLLPTALRGRAAALPLTARGGGISSLANFGVGCNWRRIHRRRLSFSALRGDSQGGPSRRKGRRSWLFVGGACCALSFAFGNNPVSLIPLGGCLVFDAAALLVPPLQRRSWLFYLKVTEAAESLRLFSPLLCRYLALRLCAELQTHSLAEPSAPPTIAEARRAAPVSRRSFLSRGESGLARSGGFASTFWEGAKGGARLRSLEGDALLGPSLPALLTCLDRLVGYIDASEKSDSVAFFEVYAALAPTLLLLLQNPRGILLADLKAARFCELGEEQRILYAPAPLVLPPAASFRLSQGAASLPNDLQRMRRLAAIEGHSQRALQLLHDELLLAVVDLLLRTSLRAVHWEAQTLYENQRPVFRRPSLVSVEAAKAAVLSRRCREESRADASLDREKHEAPASAADSLFERLRPAVAARECLRFCREVWRASMEGLQETALLLRCSLAGPSTPARGEGASGFSELSAVARLAGAAATRVESLAEAPASLAVFLAAPFRESATAASVVSSGEARGGAAAGGSSASGGAFAALRLARQQIARNARRSPPSLIVSRSAEETALAAAGAWAALECLEVGLRLGRLLWSREGIALTETTPAKKAFWRRAFERVAAVYRRRTGRRTAAGGDGFSQEEATALDGAHAASEEREAALRLEALRLCSRALLERFNAAPRATACLPPGAACALKASQLKKLERLREMLGNALNAACRTPHAKHSFQRTYDDLSAAASERTTRLSSVLLASAVALVAALLLFGGGQGLFDSATLWTLLRAVAKGSDGGGAEEEGRGDRLCGTSALLMATPGGPDEARSFSPREFHFPQNANAGHRPDARANYAALANLYLELAQLHHGTGNGSESSRARGGAGGSLSFYSQF